MVYPTIDARKAITKSQQDQMISEILLSDSKVKEALNLISENKKLHEPLKNVHCRVTRYNAKRMRANAKNNEDSPVYYSKRSKQL